MNVRVWASGEDIERLRQSVLDVKRSSDRIGYALVGLTLVLVGLTVVLVVIAVRAWRARWGNSGATRPTEIGRDRKRGDRREPHRRAKSSRWVSADLALSRTSNLRAEVRLLSGPFRPQQGRSPKRGSCPAPCPLASRPKRTSLPPDG
jgi:membrane protein required for beta-lactamase induction